jgi:pyridoxamine 5'-phosphate oxidase
MIRPEIAALRKEYKKLQLHETEVAQNPFEQFQQWFTDALQSEIEEPNAMTLATASSDGKPSARIVLLKSFDETGFIFFTNYESKKGKQLFGNPFAALVFFWKELERQVRIEGTIVKISAQESDIYFDSRPPGSRIGAWASPQSAVLKNREELENKVKKAEVQFKGISPSRPSFWGGYRLKPNLFEFWQGRSNRLHDRIQYCLQQNTTWKIDRLAP